MSKRDCPTCVHWQKYRETHYRVAKKKEVVVGLCTWPTSSARGPDVMKWSPPWMNRLVGAGDVTEVGDGKDCVVWSDGK